MPTHIDKATQEHRNKSEFDLVILREQTKTRADDPEHQAALALLHQHQVDRETKKMAQTERSLKIATIGVAVAVIGILVAAIGVAANIWSHLTPAATIAPAAQTTAPQSAKP